jgi:hypothetical protein
LASNTSKHSRILDSVVAGVVGFIICAALAYCGHLIKELYKGKLRADYPLLVYKCEYVEEYEGKKAGLFGIIEYYPQWVYRLSFANLSRTSVNNIDFSVNFGLKCGAVFIYPIGCQFFAEPKKPLSNNSFTLIGTNTDCINLLGKELISGRSASCLIVINSKERPSLSYFRINLNCSSGTFERITSTQWEQIGWQEVKN